MTSFLQGLEESRDELQAAAALQAGRELLMLNPCNNAAEKGPSLAVELLAGMNQDQVCYISYVYTELNYYFTNILSYLKVSSSFQCIKDGWPRTCRKWGTL